MGSPSRAIQRLAPAAVLALLPTLLVVTALRSGEYLFGIDVANAFYYLYGKVGLSLASGRLPVWEPESMCGRPAFAAIQSGALYPATWLSLLLPPGPCWTLLAILHLSLAGGFTCLWLRRGLGVGMDSALTGAIVFMLSGFMVTHVYAGHSSFVLAMAWLPGLLWRLERFLAGPTIRRGFLLGLFLTLMTLAGHPPCVFVGGLALAARIVHSLFGPREGRTDRMRRAGAASAALALGLLGAAPLLLPAMEFVSHSQRVEIASMQFAVMESVPPLQLATLFAPALLGDEVKAPYWGNGFYGELCGFVGVATMALAVFGAGGRSDQRRLWLGLGLFGLLMSLGSYTPFFGLFFKFFPGASLFRVPGRYLLLFTLAMTALAALGVERLRRPEPGLRRSATVLAIVAAVLMLAAGGFALTVTPDGAWRGALDGKPTRGPALDPDKRATPESATAGAAASLGWAAFVLGLTAAGAALLRFRESEAPRAAWGFAALAGIELLAFGARYFNGFPVQRMEFPAKFVAMVRDHPAAPIRIATVDQSQIDIVGRCQIAGIDHVAGYDPLLLRRYAELINVVLRRPKNAGMVVVPGARPHPVYNLLGARYWILSQPMKTPERWTSVGMLPNGLVFENPDALPRAFLVDRATVIPDLDARLSALADLAFDPRSTLVLEEGEAPPPSGEPPGSVRILSRSAGRYELESESLADAWLVLTETQYPGWTAEIDGTPAAIRTADHLVQAVRIPAGRHRVTFQYRSRHLATGFGIALATLAVPGVLALLRRTSTQPAPPK